MIKIPEDIADIVPYTELTGRRVEVPAQQQEQHQFNAPDNLFICQWHILQTELADPMYVRSYVSGLGRGQRTTDKITEERVEHLQYHLYLDNSRTFFGRR